MVGSHWYPGGWPVTRSNTENRSDAWLQWQASLLAQHLAGPALDVVRERSRLKGTAHLAFGAAAVVPALLLIGLGLTLSWMLGAVLAAGACAMLALFGLSTVQRADALRCDNDVGFLDRLHLPVHVAPVGQHQVAIDGSGLLARPRLVSPPQVPNETGLASVLADFLDAANTLPPLLVQDEILDVPMDPKVADGPSATLLGLEARLADLAGQLDMGFAALQVPTYNLPMIAEADEAFALVNEHAHASPMPGEWVAGLHEPQRILTELRATAAAVNAVEGRTGAATLVGSARTGLSTVADRFDVARTDSFQGSVFGPLDLLEASGSLAAFNFYCPTCNAAEVGRVRSRSYNHGADGVDDRIELNREARLCLNVESGRWTCQLCGGMTRTPLPIHRAMDEALLPAFDALTRQFHTDRLTIYSDIYDQKLRYRQEAEQQLDELRRANRAEVDQTMQQIRTLAAEAGEGEAALTEIGRLLGSYESLQEGRLAEIARRADRFQQEIEQSHDAWAQEYRETVNHEMQSMKADIEQCAQLERRETQLRDESLRRAAEAAERTADASEKSAAVAAADAKQRGMDKKSFLLDPLGQTKRVFDGALIDVGFKSELEVGKGKKV